MSGRVVYEYGSDGSAGMTVYRPSGEPLGGAARWTVKSEQDKTIVIHVKGQGIEEERTITFTDNDTHRWTSPGKPYVEFRRVR